MENPESGLVRLEYAAGLRPGAVRDTLAERIAAIEESIAERRKELDRANAAARTQARVNLDLEIELGKARLELCAAREEIGRLRARKGWLWRLFGRGGV